MNAPRPSPARPSTAEPTPSRPADPPTAEWGKGADGRSYGLIRRDVAFPKAALDRLEELGRGVAWRDGGEASFPPAVALLPVGEAGGGRGRGWLSVVLTDAGADAAGRPHTLALHATFHAAGHPHTPPRLPTVPILLHTPAGCGPGRPTCSRRRRSWHVPHATGGAIPPEAANGWFKALLAGTVGFLLGAGLVAVLAAAAAAVRPVKESVPDRPPRTDGPGTSPRSNRCRRSRPAGSITPAG